MSTYLNRGIIGYLITTVVCVIFTVIYEFLGHGVYSWRIRLLALIPLAMFGLFLIMKKVKFDFEPYLAAITFLRLFAASEIARNAFIGIIKVYGTVSSAMYYLYILSILFAGASIISFSVCLIIRITHRRSAE